MRPLTETMLAPILLRLSAMATAWLVGSGVTETLAQQAVAGVIAIFLICIDLALTYLRRMREGRK